MQTRSQRVVADCCRTTGTQCHLLTELAPVRHQQGLDGRPVELLRRRSRGAGFNEGCALLRMTSPARAPFGRRRDRLESLAGLSPIGPPTMRAVPMAVDCRRRQSDADCLSSVEWAGGGDRDQPART